MPSLRCSKRFLCPRCGEPIAKKGIHFHCRRPDEHNRQSDIDEVHLARVEKRIREEFYQKTVKKHWSKDMGKEALLSMFPDMEDRTQ